SGGQVARVASEIFGPGIVGRSGWIELTASDSGGNGFFLLFDSPVSTSEGGAVSNRPSQRLVFPRVDKDTILYVVNTGDGPIPTAAVSLYDNSGALLGRTNVSIDAKAGWSSTVADILSSVKTIDGYVVFDAQGTPFATSGDTLVGMETYQRGGSAIVPAQADSELVQRGYAVHVVIGGGYTSRLTLVNPTSVPQQVQLTLNGTTIQRNIAANARLDESLAQSFNISSGGQTTGYLKVGTSDPGLIGYVEIATSGGALTTTPIAQDAQPRL